MVDIYIVYGTWRGDVYEKGQDSSCEAGDMALDLDHKYLSMGNICHHLFKFYWIIILMAETDFFYSSYMGVSETLVYSSLRAEISIRHIQV